MPIVARAQQRRADLQKKQQIKDLNEQKYFYNSLTSIILIYQYLWNEQMYASNSNGEG